MDNDTIRIPNERHAGIVIKDNKILLMHRKKKGREFWVIPGGHRHEGEVGEEVVIREIAEETNIAVENAELVFEFRDYKKNNFDFYYVCRWVSGEKPELVGEEAIENSEENFYEPMWLELEKFSALNVLPKFAKEWVERNVINSL